MAIDDNTSYELTGAQVKDLANKIKAKAADNIFVGATSALPGSKGLVPAPQAADDTKFLSGDGTWKTVSTGPSYSAGTGIDITSNTISIDTSVVAELSDLPSVMTGASSGTAGASGLVPAPAAGDDTKFLQGDGTWGAPTDTTYTAGTNIQISAQNVISATDTTYSAFTGATTQVAGAAGLVPAPTTSDPDKFLKGDGTWGTVSPGAVITKFYVSGTLDVSGSLFELYKDSQRTTTADDTDVANAWDAGTVMICETTTPAEYILVSNLNDMEYGIMGVDSSAQAFCGNFYAAGSSYFSVTNQFQKQLTAGSHITISSNTISANGYIWGDTLTAATTPTGTVTSGMIADGTITAADIATGVVPTITLSTTDIGEGAPLAANTLYGVYQ